MVARLPPSPSIAASPSTTHHPLAPLALNLLVIVDESSPPSIRCYLLLFPPFNMPPLVLTFDLFLFYTFLLSFSFLFASSLTLGKQQYSDTESLIYFFFNKAISFFPVSITLKVKQQDVITKLKLSLSKSMKKNKKTRRFYSTWFFAISTIHI